MADTRITFSSADDTTTVPATGTCLDCGGTIPLIDGRIPDHKVRVISHGREVDGDQQCTPETKEN